MRSSRASTFGHTDPLQAFLSCRALAFAAGLFLGVSRGFAALPIGACARGAAEDVGDGAAGLLGWGRGGVVTEPAWQLSVHGRGMVLGDAQEQLVLPPWVVFATRVARCVGSSAALPRGELASAATVRRSPSKSDSSRSQAPCTSVLWTTCTTGTPMLRPGLDVCGLS